VRRVFSPLDEELKLLSGPFTPSLVESMVWLGTWMPFVPVTKGIDYFTKVTISEPTARRKAEQAGEAYVEVQTAQVEVIERDLPESPKGPALQLMSVDGAMVPLLHKKWGEVKTLVIGTVGQPVLRKGEWEVHTDELSYFSRMTDHEKFARLATVEAHRRGTENALKVCAVNDGAEWEQKFVDYHRADAVRILDWGHSAEHMAGVGRAMYGMDTPDSKEWLKRQLDELKKGDSDKVVAQLSRLRDELAGGAGQGAQADALKVVEANLEYFEKRREQIRYAEFERLGYPIGSGAVESGNKLVVEARMKGSGMHWAPQNVDPMVALRDVACSDRWEEAWPQISGRMRQRCRERAQAQQGVRRAAKAVCQATERPVLMNVPVRPKMEALPEPAIMVSVAVKPEPKRAASSLEERAKTGPRRPAANHPWRHMPIGRARRP